MIRQLVAAAPLLFAPAVALSQSVSLLSDSTKLKVFVNVSALALVSTERPFAPGIPFLLLPESPFGFRTNTFDLHARQTNFGFLYTGPKIKGLTTGATFLAYIAKDNLVADSYGLLPFLAYGELHNEDWLFAAGLNLDVFNPLNPTIIPISILLGSGNTGDYRGQVRVERYFNPSPKRRFIVQFAVAEPVASVVTDNRRLLEDNGWPNLELRLTLGVGAEEQRLGERKSRSVGLGVSGVVGQLRSTGIITTVGQTEPADRRIVDVNGVGVDAELALGNAFGLIGEFFNGQGLGEYTGGVLQSFNSVTFQPIQSRGAFGEAFVYFNNAVHLHSGYGYDNPRNADLALLQIRRNQTGYATLYWELSKIVQLGIEAEYRKTNFFRPLRTSDGMLFMSQVLWQF